MPAHLVAIANAPDLVEQVYRALLDAISDGSLAPGSRLGQEDIAARLAVSRQPVLQALRLLKKDGLVLDAPGRGLLVAPSFGITDPTDPIYKAIRNNGGGHYNHSLFWQMMQKGGAGKPTKDMASAIDKQFGSYTKFQDQFTKAALGQFGSGWAWLSLAPDGTLKVESTANQDSPLMLGRTPLLAIDVWEHAYYLKYQNRRPEYVAAWYNTVNWDFVNDRFTQAKKAA